MKRREFIAFARQRSGCLSAHRIRAAAGAAKPGARGLVESAQGACARTRAGTVKTGQLLPFNTLSQPREAM
jgi:hypothetical protein